MSANSTNRETVRDAFATVLETALVGVGLPVQAVYNYPRGVINQTPTIAVASSGTARKPAGIGDTRKWINYFVLEVFTFIRDADEASGWTEALVEDNLDLIDKKIADVVSDNQVNAAWLSLSFTIDPEGRPEPSEIITDIERGYKIEMRKVYAQKVDA